MNEDRLISITLSVLLVQFWQRRGWPYGARDFWKHSAKLFLEFAGDHPNADILRTAIETVEREKAPPYPLRERVQRLEELVECLIQVSTHTVPLTGAVELAARQLMEKHEGPSHCNTTGPINPKGDG